jgi:hypothetical protein
MNTPKSLAGFYYNALRINKDEKLDYAKLFPEFLNFNSQKIKMLFVSPRMDENGWYQQILPALYFSRKGKYVSACITNITKSKQELDCTTSKFIIPKMLIKSADIVVFPFVTQDLELAYRAIRGINDRAKIIYTIDYDFYDIPELHAKAELFKKPEIIEAVNKNIFYADKIFVPSMNMVGALGANLQNKFPIAKNILVEHIPYLLTPENYAGIDFQVAPEIKKTEGKIRFGIISHWHNQDDVDKMKPVLKWLEKKYPDKAEVVFWGTDPLGFSSSSEDNMDGMREVTNKKAAELKDKFKNVDFINYRRFAGKNYLYYYKNLYNLGLDCLFSFRNNNDWNANNREAHEMIDASHYKIPVISNHKHTSLPDDFYFYGKTHADIKAHITNMIENYDVARSYGENAKDYVLENSVYTEERWDNLESIFLSFEENSKEK